MVQKAISTQAFTVTLLTSALLAIMISVYSYTSGIVRGKAEAVEDNKTLIEAGRLGLKAWEKCEDKKEQAQATCSLFDKGKPNYGLMVHVASSIMLCLDHRRPAACNSLCAQHGYQAFCGLDVQALDIPSVDCRGKPDGRDASGSHSTPSSHNL